jgi:ABC-2 type transport system ATP-binding protein
MYELNHRSPTHRSRPTTAVVGEPGTGTDRLDSSPHQPAVAFARVVKRYRSQRALSDITFSIEAGESVAIAGVNGAGKTTLLRCLLDFARPDAGSIRIFGVDSHRPEARRRLAFLPERFMPPAHLSGHEVLQWLAGLRGARWGREQSRIVFERFALPEAALDRAVRGYSKGMTQKLGLAAALSSGKPLLVLDEPMSGLDPQARQFVLNSLLAARAAGAGLLLTSHNLSDITRLCDRLAIVHDGELRFMGPPDELMKQHAGADLEAAFLAKIAATVQ